MAKKLTADMLKKSILQYAVEGKLVAQDVNDEPASVLIEKIKAEKEKLIEEGKIKRNKKESFIYRIDGSFYERIGKEEKCIDDEIPFDIPESWEWCRLGSVCNIINGFTPSKTNKAFWDNGKIPWFTVNDIHIQGRKIYQTEKYITEKAIAKNSNRILPIKTVLICCTASVGEYALTEIPLTTNQQFNGLVIRDYFKKDYSVDFLYLISKTFKERLLSVAGKTTFNYISVKKVSNLLIPFLPLAEQKRIVAKIEEVLPLVEEYAKKEKVLNAINDNFHDMMKKSILQYAVEGKLVAQDKNDEPASVLIEKIRAEKEKLIEEGKIKRNKKESFIYRKDDSFYERVGKAENCIDDEIPFDIPESWEWCRLGSILEKLTDGAHKTPRYVDKGIPFLSVKDISGGEIKFDNCKFISVEEHEKLYSRCNAEYGDILLTKVGTTGIPVIVDTEIEFSLFVSVALLKFNKNYIHNKYFQILINSPLVQEQASQNTKGVGNKNWVMRDIAKTLVVLPPLAEQKRIVAKIEELMPFIEESKNIFARE